MMLPLESLAVTVRVPAGVPVATFLFVLMVRVEVTVPLDENVTELGLKVPLANFGRPLTLRFTVPTYPAETTLIVSEPLEPAAGTVIVPPLLSLRVTPPEVAALTVSVGVVWLDPL